MFSMLHESTLNVIDFHYLLLNLFHLKIFRALKSKLLPYCYLLFYNIQTRTFIKYFLYIKIAFFIYILFTICNIFCFFSKKRPLFDVKVGYFWLFGIFSWLLFSLFLCLFNIPQC